MLYYPISALINTIVFIIICLIAIFNNPRSRLNRSFSYFCISVIFWSTSYFFWQISDNASSALYWCRNLTSGACFIPSTIFHFLLILINYDKKHHRLIQACYFLSIFFFILNFTPLLVKNVQPRLFFPYWPSPGPFYSFFLIFFIFTPLYSLILGLKKYKNFDKDKQNQLKYVFIGIIVGYVGGCTNYPLWYDVPIPPYGNILVSGFGTFLAYAIVKHHLMDIRVVIKKSIIYSISIATMSLLYLLSIFILEKTAQKIFGYSTIGISISIAFALGLLFIPLRYKIQYFMDRYFFKGSTAEIATQNEQLRQDIAQSEKYKTLSTLATGIAHEIKNPLTAIRTFTEYLPQKLDDKEFLKKFADIVSREVNRIDDMVHELLEYGKPAPLSITKTDIHKLINDTLDILSSKFVAKKISVIKHLASSLPTGQAGIQHLNIDPNQIKQALLNIFFNAIEAMPHGGTLTVSTFVSQASYFIIEVEDTGNGIPREDLSRIFDPYFSKKDHGTGLGLSITQSLIENHKGVIQIKSKAGIGTSVRIDLPV